MAMDKESNTYTIIFATIMVVVVGGLLAFLALSLKERQEANGEIKKKMEVLSALLSPDEMKKVSRENAEAEYEKYITGGVVLDGKGKVIFDGEKGKVEAFQTNIQKDYKDKTLVLYDSDPKVKQRTYPMFTAKKEGKTFYIIPIVGMGLWGPIWGNVCIAEDKSSIAGASFGNKGETPGLGAEISMGFFIDRWVKGDEKITDENGDYQKFDVVKDGTGGQTTKIDGISGGTITSEGVEEMMNRCLVPYTVYFKTL